MRTVTVTVFYVLDQTMCHPGGTVNTVEDLLMAVVTEKDRTLPPYWPTCTLMADVMKISLSELLIFMPKLMLMNVHACVDLMRK